MLIADPHLDSKGHLSNELAKLLKTAREHVAPVVFLGDIFDAMQGPRDPRGEKGSTKKEHEGRDYFDRLVDTAADTFEPFAHSIVYMGTGNHETSVMKHYGTNLIERLAKELRSRTGAMIVPAGYRGWIRFMFQYYQNRRASRAMYWCHGTGGGGVMTFGTLAVRRRSGVVPDADIVVSGHTHEDFSLRIGRYRLSHEGTEYRDDQLHISVPSLKDSQTGKPFSWEGDKELPPKPTGAYWLTFTISEQQDENPLIVANAERIIPSAL